MHRKHNALYIHPIIHTIKIFVTCFLNKYVWWKKDSHTIELVLAASIVAAFYNKENQEKSGKCSSLRIFLTMASGIPFVVVLDFISYIPYDIRGDIQRLIANLKIDPNIEGKVADKLFVVIRLLDIYFILPWAERVILLCKVLVRLYYIIGHPRKDIINQIHSNNDIIL